MSQFVHHYTDTGRLPWILRSGTLLPGRNRLGFFPEPDFLWGSTSPVGERTASANLEALRQGKVRFVRFVLAAEDFEGWPDITARFPAWTPAQVDRLRIAAPHSDPRTWRCRAEELPAGRWLDIETRSYTDKVWRPMPRPWVAKDIHVMGHADVLGDVLCTEIAGRLYSSRRLTGPGGMTGYLPNSIDAREAA